MAARKMIRSSMSLSDGLLAAFLIVGSFNNPELTIAGIDVFVSDLLFGALIACHASQVRSLGGRSTPYFLLMLLLLLYYLGLFAYSIVWLGKPPAAGLGRLINLFVYPLFLFVGLCRSDDSSALERTNRVFMFVGSLIVVMAAVRVLWPALGHRLVPEVVNTAYFTTVSVGGGFVLAYVLSLIVANLLMRSDVRWTLVFVSAVAGVVLLGSQKRSLILAVTAALSLIVWFARPRPRQWFSLAVSVAVAVALALGAVTVNPDLEDAYQRRAQRTVRAFDSMYAFVDSPVGIRFWRTAGSLRRWAESPIVGVGWGNQGGSYAVYDAQGRISRVVEGSPHNYYAALLEQTGGLGFLLMTMLGFQIIVELVRQRYLQPTPETTALLAFALSSLLYAATNVYFYGHPVIVPSLFLLLGTRAATTPLRPERS